MHNNTRHAPRERVSWNNSVRHFTANFLQSRSTWACELKLYTIFSFLILNGSRSTWACELKFNLHFCKWHLHLVTLHVSVWVEIQNLFAHINNVFVTLHVSVWVEIATRFSNCCTLYVTLHVSVWVEIQCPLKLCDSIYRHAPRERVSWNSSISSNIFAMSVTLHVSVWVEIITFSYFNQSARRHAPRERVSWNEKRVAEHNNFARSRSTWACELKYAIKSKNI